MAVDTSIPHHFLGSSKTLILSSVVMLLTAIAFSWATVSGPEAWVDRGHRGGVYSYYMIAALTPFVWLMAWLGIDSSLRVSRLQGNPVLEITGAGIFDRRLMKSRLAWSDISDVDVFEGKRLRPSVVKITLSSNATIEFASHAIRLASLMNKGGHASISAVGLTASFETLSSVLMAFWTEMKR